MKRQFNLKIVIHESTKMDFLKMEVNYMLHSFTGNDVRYYLAREGI